MDDSSDLEFETMLCKIKSTCKKKKRKKMVNNKLCQSCPQSKYLHHNQEDISKLDDSYTVVTTPKNEKKFGLDKSVKTCSKSVTPMLDLQCLLDSSDEDICRNASSIITTPAKTPRQNLTRLLTDTEDEIQNLLFKCPTGTNLSQPTYDRGYQTYSQLLRVEDMGCEKREDNAPSPISLDHSDDKLEELTENLGRFHLKHQEIPYNGTSMRTPNITKLIQQPSAKKVFWDNDVQVFNANEKHHDKDAQIINKRPLNEDGLNCTLFTTPGNKTPAGLRDGYFGSTSKKTPKNNMEFLLSCLDDSFIESKNTTENIQQVKLVDYSKPVPLHLYTKQGVNSFLAALSPENFICHYDAQKYVYQYDLHKNNLVNVLYYFFNKFVFDNKLPDDMPIRWTGLSSAAGNCECTRIPGTSTKCCKINLSRKLLNTADKLRDTLIHELCHAATHLISEERDVHGPFWRYWTRVAKLAFPDLPFISRCHSYK